MPPRKQKAVPAESPAIEQMQAVIERQRAQITTLAEGNAALEAEIATARRAKSRPSRKFETEKIRVNGFTITVAGKDCDEADAWIERVGDTVIILTGRAAEAKRNGETVTLAAIPSFGGIMRAPSAPAGEVPWTNLDAMKGSPIGLGPSPNMSEEDKARLMVAGTLDQIERNIITSGGNAGIQ